MASIEIPGYEIYEQLGRGGMATVYRALHLNLEREVAIKVIDTERIADDSFSERFLREARISARLTHPRILQIYDVNVYGNLSYISMELLHGGDLEGMIRGAMNQRTIYQVMAQMTAALDYAADQGYVHRDIKPSNIMVRGPGDFVLTDFGIAKAADSSTQMTQAGLLVGTPSYMSPEQAEGATLDGRSDLYSLAVVCYEMLTKTVPFESDSAVSLAVKHLTEKIPRLPRHLAAYQPFLDKGLAKKPEDRFQSGREMYEAFCEVRDRFDDDEVLTAPRATPDRPTFSPGTELMAGGSGLWGSALDTGDDDSGHESPEPVYGEDGLLSGIRSDPPLRPPPGRRRRTGARAAVLTSALVLLAVAGAGAGYLYWQSRDSAAPASPPDRVAAQQEVQDAAEAAQEPPVRGELDALLADGRDRLAREDYPAAGEKFRAALALAPDDPEATGLLQDSVDALAAQAESAIAAGDFKRAERALTSALALAPEREALTQSLARLPELEAQHRQQRGLAEARALLEEERYREAGERFLQLADGAVDPGPARDGLRASVEGLLAAARSDLEQNRFDRAGETLDTARAWLPDDPGVQQLATRLSQREQAYREEQASLARREAEANRRANAALRAMGQGDLREARSDFVSLEEDFPDMGVTGDVRQRLLDAYTRAVKEEIDVQSWSSARALIAEGEPIAPGRPVWAELREEVEYLEANDKRRLGAY